MKAMGIVSARVRAMGHILAGLASDNVEARVARLLMRFAAIASRSRRCAATAPGELCVNVRLRHQDIANLVRASRQTVTTTLLQMRRMQAIRVIDHHFHIMQPQHFRGLLELNNV